MKEDIIDEILREHPELDRKTLEMFKRIAETKEQFTVEALHKAFANVKRNTKRD